MILYLIFISFCMFCDLFPLWSCLSQSVFGICSYTLEDVHSFLSTFEHKTLNVCRVFYLLKIIYLFKLIILKLFHFIFSLLFVKKYTMSIKITYTNNLSSCNIHFLVLFLSSSLWQAKVGFWCDQGIFVSLVSKDIAI